MFYCEKKFTAYFKTSKTLSPFINTYKRDKKKHIFLLILLWMLYFFCHKQASVQ